MTTNTKVVLGGFSNSEYSTLATACVKLELSIKNFTMMRLDEQHYLVWGDNSDFRLINLWSTNTRDCGNVSLAKVKGVPKKAIRDLARGVMNLREMILAEWDAESSKVNLVDIERRRWEAAQGSEWANENFCTKEFTPRVVVQEYAILIGCDLEASTITKRSDTLYELKTPLYMLPVMIVTHRPLGRNDTYYRVLPIYEYQTFMITSSDKSSENGKD